VEKFWASSFSIRTGIDIGLLLPVLVLFVLSRDQELEMTSALKY
jgi:hypothetical protein